MIERSLAQLPEYWLVCTILRTRARYRYHPFVLVSIRLRRNSQPGSHLNDQNEVMPRSLRDGTANAERCERDGK